MTGGQPVRPTGTTTPDNPLKPGDIPKPTSHPRGPGKKGGPIIGGGMVGGGSDPTITDGFDKTAQDKDGYKPFENDKVKWATADSEAAVAAVGKAAGTRPALLLLLSDGDATKCMAKNFERVILKDSAVLALLEKQFTAVKLDRTSDKAKVFETKGPELVILDAEGDEVARFVECSEASIVLGILKEAVARQKETATKTADWTPRVARGEKLFEDGKTKDAVDILLRARKEARLSKQLRDKVAAFGKSVEDKATELLASAKAKEDEDPVAAWRLYRQVRDDYWGLPASTTAKNAIAAIEKNPANKDRLEEARKAEAKGKTDAPKPSEEPSHDFDQMKDD